ncbi:hypothetical protein N0V90_009482 [Kalmusia sp. IMI 367209]|nr:hypothetical protein N0V90_009482 [Kalmusia sp. IMI 367209]
MKLKYVFWGLAATVCAVPLKPRFDYSGLSFSKGSFHITMFNDLHMGDRGDQDGSPKKKDVWSDDATIDVMNKILSFESTTDLAVLNGDLLSCEWVGGTAVYDLLNKVMSPFIHRKTPFAATYGNHDWSPTCNTRWMSEHMWRTANDRKNGRQLTFTMNSLDGDPNVVGSSNYFIPLYSTSSGKRELRMILWFFDSKGGFLYTGDGNNQQSVEDWVNQKVINWFKQTRDQIENSHGGKTIPSLVFVHIPIPITDKFARSGKRSRITEPGIQNERLSVQGDAPVNADQAVPFMQALADTKGLLGVFSGHDHATDWCMKWAKTPEPIPADWPTSIIGNGLNICFGRHTGYGGYGEYMRGGRHIIIHEEALEGDNAIETWMRLENGEISGRVTLNSTYGTDEYPPVALKYSTYSQADSSVASEGFHEHSSITTNDKDVDDYDPSEDEPDEVRDHSPSEAEYNETNN